MMPIQLSRAKRPKRLEPRPIVELLQCVSIDDLCRLKAFPTKDQRRSILSITFKYPFLKRLKRLEARLDPNASQQLLTVKRLSHPNITMPQHNYGTCGRILWR